MLNTLFGSGSAGLGDKIMNSCFTNMDSLSC